MCYYYFFYFLKFFWKVFCKLRLRGNLGNVGPKLLRRRNSLGPTSPRLPVKVSFSINISFTVFKVGLSLLLGLWVALCANFHGA